MYFPDNVHAGMFYKINQKKNKTNIFKEFNSHFNFNKKLAYSRQTHSDIIKIINYEGNAGNCDSMISRNANIILAIQVADCLPVFITNVEKNIFSLVHAGWRGTKNKILYKTIINIVKIFKSDIKDLSVFIGPCIKKCCYEVGKDVSSHFDKKYLFKKKKHYMLDLVSINIDQLNLLGIKKDKIFFDDRCTFCSNKNFHSFRRDSSMAGRNICYLTID